MKLNKVFFSAVIAIMLMAVITLSSTTQDQSKIESAYIESSLDLDNRCSPPGWVLVDLNNWPDDPALKWDKNGDKFVCFKGVDWGGTTPKGKGNDPLWDQSNVKDNNYPCFDFEFEEFEE